MAFKVWRLSAALKITAALLGIAAVVGLAWAWTIEPALTVIPAVSHRQLLQSAALLVAAVFATQWLARWIVGAFRWRESLYRVAVGIGMSVVGWLAARIHLLIFDRIYLKLGSAARFQEEAERERRTV